MQPQDATCRHSTCFHGYWGEDKNMFKLREDADEEIGQFDRQTMSLCFFFCFFITSVGTMACQSFPCKLAEAVSIEALKICEATSKKKKISKNRTGEKQWPGGKCHCTVLNPDLVWPFVKPALKAEKKMTGKPWKLSENDKTQSLMKNLNSFHTWN